MRTLISVEREESPWLWLKWGLVIPRNWEPLTGFGSQSLLNVLDQIASRQAVSPHQLHGNNLGLNMGIWCLLWDSSTCRIHR